MGPAQPGHDAANQARSLAAPVKVRPRFEGQTDPRETGLEIFERDGPPARRRIIQPYLPAVAIDAFDHEKMMSLPKDDKWCGDGAEILCRAPQTFREHPVTARC